MENSIITKKTNLSKFVNFVKSRLDNTPVIVNNKDNVRVGNYVCIQDSGQWTVLYKKTLIEKFTLRASAVAWCIATIAERYNDAKVVKKEDLEYSYEKSRKSLNVLKVDRKKYNLSLSQDDIFNPDMQLNSDFK